MEMHDIVSESGNLQKAGFENGKMRVVFKSGVTHEYDATAEEWEPFQKTFKSKEMSSGSHFAKHFRKRNSTKL